MESKQSVEAIVKNEELLITALDYADVGAIFVSCEGKFLKINETFSQMTGYSKEDLLTMSIREITFSDDMEKIEVCLKNLLQSERGTCRLEKRFITKNRSIIWTDIKMTLLFDSDNTPLHFVMFITDITKYKQADQKEYSSAPVPKILTEHKPSEETLRDNEESFRQMADNLGEVFWLKDCDNHQFVYINKAFENIWGRNRDDLYSDPDSLLEFIHEEDKLTVSSIQEGPGKNSSYNIEYRIIRPDNQIIWIWERSFPVKDSNDNIIGFTGIAVDITENKKIIKELIKAKEKAEEFTHIETYFLDNMSHELRTPMIGILGFSDILLNEVTDESIREKVQIIYDNSQRMMEAINLILDLSKLEAGKSEMSFDKIDISEVIKKTCKLFITPAKRKNLTLEINADDNFVILTDEKMLSKITYNLVNNAIKFTETGKIEINVVKEVLNDKESICIYVKDTGIGIPADKLGIIFEPFRQVSEGTKRKYEGTGVGLTITKKLVELLKGQISVKSIPGQGSIFQVSFPYIPINSDNNDASRIFQQTTFQKYTIPDKTGLPSILAVDDDLTARVMYKISLKNICILDLAEDADSALKLIKKKDYDIILMDINLSGDMNGLELTNIIRGIEKYKTIPIIAATAYALKGDKESFLAEGCSHYLAKPFTKKTLMDLIKTIIKQ